jgi:hypothetical protein
MEPHLMAIGSQSSRSAVATVMKLRCSKNPTRKVLPI